MDNSQRLKLENLRQVCFEQLKKGNRRKASYLVRMAIHRAIVHHNGGLVTRFRQQIAKDLGLYPLFDALAMWTDPDAGLAAYEPEFIIKLATELVESEAIS